MKEMDEPGWYNEFVRRLKGKILGGELGGERREMWWEIRRERLGLIDKKASEQSDVGEEAAKEVSFLVLFERWVANLKLVPYIKVMLDKSTICVKPFLVYECHDFSDLRRM